VAALNLWRDGFLLRQSRDELELSARRHITLVGARLDRTIATLDELAARGVDSCRASNVEAMRQATFNTIPIKELSIVSPEGRTLCTDVGSQPEQRKIISSEPVAQGSHALLEMVRLGPQAEPWIRIRRPGTGLSNGIAALLPAALFVPQVSTRGGPIKFRAQMVTSQGAVLAQAGDVTAVRDPADLIEVSYASNRYRLRAVVSGSHAELSSKLGDLRGLGTIASGS
jgi:hypothetical protein